MRFNVNAFPQNDFQEMHENNDENKASKPWLLILFLGRILRQELPDISAE